MKSSLARRALLFVALSLAALLLWAARGPQATRASPSPLPVAEPGAVARERGRLPPAVKTLLEQKSSAYQARLFADEGGVVLVTHSGFARFRAGETAEEHTIPLGPVAVPHGGSIVFWRSGALREVSMDGGSERRLAPLTQAPQYLLASESRLAWIAWQGETGASLQTLSAGKVRVVYESADRVFASVLRESVVYSIVQRRDGPWKIASIGLDSAHRKRTEEHRGRPPAMLALGPDGIYFYDGPERGVRRLTFELDREDAVSTNVICSPLAVSDRAVCAQVGGLFEIPSSGVAPRFLTAERAGPITALAVTKDRVFWVAENGADQLLVRTAPLAGL